MSESSVSSSDTNSTDYGEDHAQELIKEKEARMRNAGMSANKEVKRVLNERLSNIGFDLGQLGIGGASPGLQKQNSVLSRSFSAVQSDAESLGTFM